MKKGSHQKEIPMENFEEEQPQKQKEKTPFFEEDDAISTEKK